MRGFCRGGWFDWVDPVSLKIGYGTDLHYSSANETHENLYLSDGALKASAAVDELGNHALDLVVFSGDMVEGNPGASIVQADMATITDLFATLDAPTYYVLGNHDFDGLSNAQAKAAFGLAIGHYSFDANGIHIVVLDGNYNLDDDSSAYATGNSWNYLNTYVNPAQRAWLAADLAATALPVVVFVHQRLDGVGDAFVDNAPAVRAVLEAGGNVAAVFQGHHHTNDCNRINGIPYISMAAMANGPAPTNAFAVIEIGSHIINIKGFGWQFGRTVAKLV